VKVKVANKKYFCKRKQHPTTFSSIHLAKTKLFLNFADDNAEIRILSVFMYGKSVCYCSIHIRT